MGQETSVSLDLIFLSTCGSPLHLVLPAGTPNGPLLALVLRSGPSHWLWQRQGSRCQLGTQAQEDEW